MNALVFDSELRLVRDYSPPEVGDEVIIAPKVVGICNTDIEITRGYMGFQGVVGHEFVGTVVESPAHPHWVGQRVVGEINAACGNCIVCRRGDRPHCPNRTTLGIMGRDGAMSQRFRLPADCLHRVPDSIADEVAVFVEPLAAALEIVDQIHIRPDDRIVVIGDGKLGSLIVQVMRLFGGEVFLVGKHPERWELFGDQGIVCVAVDAIPDTTFDVVIDCTGQASGLQIARQLVRPRGRLVLKSTFHGTSNLNLSMLVVDEISLIGSRCGPLGRRCASSNVDSSKRRH